MQVSVPIIDGFWREARLDEQEAVLRYAVLHVFFSSRRRHTRFDCDWSSDVCSSDLKHRGEEELGPVEFMDALEEKLKVIGWDDSYLNRPVNDGFSGGEKKRNEILQLAVLEPKLAILDETDSGLDIDALKTVAQTVEKLRRPHNATVIVTHYYRILTHIQPDVVHVLSAGRIVKSGGKELAVELEEKGYDWIREVA